MSNKVGRRVVMKACVLPAAPCCIYRYGVICVGYLPHDGCRVHTHSYSVVFHVEMGNNQKPDFARNRTEPNPNIMVSFFGSLN